MGVPKEAQTMNEAVSMKRAMKARRKTADDNDDEADARRHPEVGERVCRLSPGRALRCN